jgi:lactoylglutathione lyase
MKNLTPNLMVYNVNDTIDYYETNFNFKLSQTVPDEGQFQWAMVKNNNVNLMFQSIDSLRNDLPQFEELEPGGGLTLFIEVENLEELYNNVKDNVEVIVDFHKTFYGMNEFSIRDLNGFLVTFAQPAE